MYDRDQYGDSKVLTDLSDDRRFARIKHKISTKTGTYCSFAGGVESRWWKAKMLRNIKILELARLGCVAMTGIKIIKGKGVIPCIT